ncbi:hypothetical protein NQZ79_g7739 [Umbelopsis isabellina]|nr:hypothetical protein NQZ79_g7739 [Umbelopsis isabellina]
MLACSDTDYVNRTYYQHLPQEEEADVVKEKRVCISTAQISANRQNFRSPFVRHLGYTIDLSGQDISELMPIPLMLEASQSFNFKYILNASLSTITHLKLAYNSLETLPENIGAMESLVHLDVSHNRLKRLPTSIGSLTKLSVLQVRDNFLEELPQEIGQLNALSALDISQNNISFLPAEIVRLGSLCRLITTRCPLIEAVPTSKAHNPCSLREACARTIIRHHIPLQDNLPMHIRNYVISAKECSVCAQPCYERILYRYKLHDRGGGQIIPLRYTLCSAHWNDHDESLLSMFSARSTPTLQRYMKDSAINTQLVPVEPASTNHRASIVRPLTIQSPERKNTLWRKATKRLLSRDVVA